MDKGSTREKEPGIVVLKYIHLLPHSGIFQDCFVVCLHAALDFYLSKVPLPFSGVFSCCRDLGGKQKRSP